MKSSIFNVVGDFFALDIGSSAIRVMQLKGNSHNLMKYGSTPVDIKVSLSDAPIDQKKIRDTILALVTETGISTRNVVVGLPANKTFVTIVDLPKMTTQELQSTIRYQADQYIPMNPEDAKIDSMVLGDSPIDPEKMEVLIASVTNKFSEQRMEMLESIGFDVIGLEPDALGLARALNSPNNTQAQMIIDMGEYATDIVITLGGFPRLVRSIPTGGQSLLKAAQQNLNIDENQARQFVYKFGLDKAKLEGQIFRALSSTVEVVAAEIQKSLKFFATRYQNTPLSGIVTSGAASTLPGFAQYISVSAGNAPVQPGNSWQNVTYGNSMHEELMNVNPEFAVASGLAQRSGS